jgi:hypothetical protein
MQKNTYALNQQRMQPLPVVPQIGKNFDSVIQNAINAQITKAVNVKII